MTQQGTGLLKDIRISTKVILGGLIITSLFVLTTFLLIIPTAEKALIAKKREKLREETETAWSIFHHFNSLVEKNLISLKEAQKQAADIVGHMRYGPQMKDYFWINDMHPTMIMHPYKPELDGDDLSTFEDPSGVALFVEMVNVCKQDGAGFVRYSWQWQDDAARIVPKISYVRLFRPWGWIVGTGMYIEDVRAEIKAWKIRLSQVSTVIALIGIILSWMIGRAAARQIQSLSSPQDDAGSEHNLAIKLQTFVLLSIVPALLAATLYWSGKFYSDLHDAIIDGFNRKLASLSSSTGCFIKGEDHAAIYAGGDMKSPLYQKYVRTMKRILDQTGLTYLYTQVLLDKPKCVYVLDATQESKIGDEDSLDSTDYDGAHRVLLYGIVHIGDITATEQWGLLKVSYAPIFNSDNTITSMTGADINITIVNKKTRVALFILGLLAVGAALGAGLISIQFSKKLINPITRLRDGALMIAAGAYNHRVDITTPSELSRLSSAFNGLGTKLKDTVHSLRSTNRKICARRANSDLLAALEKTMHACSQQVCEQWAFCWTGDAERPTLSGCTGTAGRAVAWLARENKLNTFETLSKRAEICAIISGGFDQPSDPELQAVIKYSSEGITCRTVTAIPVLTFGNGIVADAEIKKGSNQFDADAEWIIIADRMNDIRDDIRKTLAGIEAQPASAIELIGILAGEITSGPDQQIFIAAFRNGKAKQ